MRLDAHQHFWTYDAKAYPWISDELNVLKRDFLPHDLKPLLRAEKMDGCIAVQARQTLEETHWLLQLAQNNEWIKGVVGWIDLRCPSLEPQLERLKTEPKLVGFRHVVQDEPKDDFMLQRDFLNGIKSLGKYNFTYDILIFPKQLPAALALAKRFPNQKFVIDHIAKPPIASGEMEFWQKQVRLFASLENVYCKISGMVTEAKWNKWTKADFTPYLDTVCETFGTKRIMFGSDWPVCLLAAKYTDVAHLAKAYFSPFSAAEQADVFGNNGARFYLNRHNGI